MFVQDKGASDGKLNCLTEKLGQLLRAYLGDDLNALSDQVGRVETNTKLTDHGNVSSRLQKHKEKVDLRNS